MLTFDEAQHVYAYKGARVPNVTSIIAPLSGYDMIPRDRLEIARQRGIAVHRMIELWAAGDLGDMPEWMEPVFSWWLRFVADTGIRIIASELRVHHKGYGYAGTLDLLCELPNTNLRGVGLIDAKRSFLGGRSIGLQTAAYFAAHNTYPGDLPQAKWRGALRLREDCPYKLLSDRDDRNIFSPTDQTVFLSQLTVSRWKEQQAWAC